MARKAPKISSTGFRKGFLLSKPSKKKQGKKPSKVSCALLGVENDPKPLLFVTKDEPSDNPVTLEEPLHVVIHEEDDFGLTEVSTRSKARLIQDVSEDHATLDESIGSTSFLPAKDKRTLFREVQTSKIFKNGPQDGAVDVKLSDSGTENSHLRKSMNHSHLGLESRSMPPSADFDSFVDEAVSTTCFPQLAQMISCILWKPKRSDQDEAIDQFVSNHLHSDQERAFVWDAILEAIAQDPSDKNPSVRLGAGLLQHRGMDSLVSFLQPNDNDKRSRVLALGAAELVGCYFQNGRETNNSTLQSWVTVALPPLARVVLICPTKRSLLSQRCMTAAYDIFVAACKHNDGIPVHDVKLSIWDAMSTLDGLLQVQHGWIEKSLHSGNSSPSDFSADVSRKQCTLAVLRDWRLVIKDNLRILERILIEDGDDADESRAELTKIVCMQFTGEYVNDITFTTGGLTQTLSDDPPKLSAQQILTCMQCAAELLHSIRENEGSDDVLSWKKERVRALLRGVAAWLGQSKKNLLSSSKESVEKGGPGADGLNREKTVVEQATDLCICLLRLDSNESVELVLAILSHLWSSSNGLPPDFVHDETLESSTPTVPASFHLLLDELKHIDTNDSTILEPRERALCFLVARCIEFRGASFVDELVTRNGLRSSTIEILAKILADTVQIDLSRKGTKKVVDDSNLLTRAGSAFLGCLGSSRYAQRKVMLSPELLSGLPIAMVVPRLVLCGDSEEISNETITVVTAALTQIMVSSLPNNVDKFVHVFVEALLRCDEKDTAESSCEEENLRSKKLCQKVAGKWRRCLLQNPVCGMHGFANVLSSIANAMFVAPSSTVPLILLGCVVGNEPLLDISAQGESLRVYFAVVSLIRDSLKEMVKAGEKAGTSVSTYGERKEQEEVFSRLSPLLLLRRIPSAYYNTAWRCISGEYRDLVPLLSQLADQLLARLDISKPPKHSNASFTADERRLAAEIAGRALPFYALPSCSCYHKICGPAFSSTLCLLKVIPGEASLSPNKSLRASRASLYSCCHHVPLAEDKEPGEGITATVSFVLEVLNAQVADAVDDNGIEDEFIQLQTGCIEFIAVCLESTLRRRTRQRDNDTRELLGVVSKVELAVNNHLDQIYPSTCAGSTSTVEALYTSCGSIVSFLKTGAPIASQLRVANNGFFSGADYEGSQQLSPSARTCLWNAFLIVSQRCPEAQGRLNSWASLTAPWILAWGSYATVDGNLHHPLCMAASLHVMFVLLTRTKSFDCLAGGKKDSTTACVRRVHEWAITSIKTKTQIGGDYARTTMRKAALKLLLAIITIDHMGDNNNLGNWLSPGELGGAFTILHGTANVDADAEVRMLAANILSTMRVS